MKCAACGMSCFDGVVFSGTDVLCCAVVTLEALVGCLALHLYSGQSTHLVVRCSVCLDVRETRGSGAGLGYCDMVRDREERKEDV